jgi:hypothetical protein
MVGLKPREFGQGQTPHAECELQTLETLQVQPISHLGRNGTSAGILDAQQRVYKY